MFLLVSARWRGVSVGLVVRPGTFLAAKSVVIKSSRTDLHLLQIDSDWLGYSCV